MNCKVIPIDLKLRREFIVSRGRASIRRNFIFEIEDIGLGEAAGSMHYGVSSGQIEDDLIRLKAAISRIDTDDLPDFLDKRRNDFCAPALCAVSTAWHDWCSKNNRKALRTRFGVDRPPPMKSSVTVSVADFEGLGDLARAGFNIIKVKMDADREAAKTLNETLGRCASTKIRIDANGSWNLDDALEMAEILPANRIELIEQPFPPEAVEDWKKFRERFDIPLFMDEGIATSRDINKHASYVDGVNIKIQKSGRLESALEAMKAAGKAGLKVMLGCMLESSVGIAAAHQLSAPADYLDLDGRWLLTDDPFVGLEYDGALLKINGNYGHGVRFA